MWFLYLDEMVGEYSNCGRFLRTFFSHTGRNKFLLGDPAAKLFIVFSCKQT